ncbi:PIR Superfamily Protein [Plasmodium ovale wallikeri]|uniref:PIR Superfamily Protein n=1 Tax=Plasmodium ovale wallikeri TaxID=864142 RepID=A0A1A9ALE5_PLAOA|nr:PIR Superfamily Protein [Plasmodium ovale wallikeri]SBT57046.1 PIR Superfamily Protein [Plasmodium ovale wallikeri]
MKLFFYKYTFVSSLDEYNDKLVNIDVTEGLFGESKCINFGKEYFKDVDKTCEQIFKYLNNLKARTHKSYRIEGCKYLNYRIYKEDILKENVFFNALSFYKYLIVEDEDYIEEDVCDGYIESISKDVVEKADKLIDLHNEIKQFVQSKLSVINDRCNYAKKCFELYVNLKDTFCITGLNTFCNELVKLKEKYDKEMQLLTCSDAPKTLPSIQNYDLTFNAYGIFLHPRIRKLKKIWNNKDLETEQISNVYDNNYSNINNNKYCISYHSL